MRVNILLFLDEFLNFGGSLSVVPRVVRPSSDSVICPSPEREPKSVWWLLGVCVKSQEENFCQVTSTVRKKKKTHTLSYEYSIRRQQPVKTKRKRQRRFKITQEISIDTKAANQVQPTSCLITMLPRIRFQPWSFWKTNQNHMMSYQWNKNLNPNTCDPPTDYGYKTVWFFAFSVPHYKWWLLSVGSPTFCCGGPQEEEEEALLQKTTTNSPLTPSEIWFSSTLPWIHPCHMRTFSILLRPEWENHQHGLVFSNSRSAFRWKRAVAIQYSRKCIQQ